MARLFGKKRHKNHTEAADVSLNITAMADIFTVLIVFLLKGFASGSLAVTPSAGLVLPSANAEVPQFEALKIEIAESGVNIESQPAAKLTQFRFNAKEQDGNGASRVLSLALKKERDRQLMIAKSNPSVQVDAKVLIIADQRAPYETIKTVLASAALNGYTDFKLAVVKND